MKCSLPGALVPPCVPKPRTAIGEAVKRQIGCYRRYLEPGSEPFEGLAGCHRFFRRDVRHALGRARWIESLLRLQRRWAEVERFGRRPRPRRRRERLSSHVAMGARGERPERSKRRRACDRSIWSERPSSRLGGLWERDEHSTERHFANAVL